MQQADHQTYRRGAGAAWLGACVQAILGVLMFVYGILGNDHAAVTASIMIGLGIPVWVFVAIVLDQHRRERLEAFEADAFMETDAATSSMFEKGGDDLRVAARRLRTMHRLVLPGMSLIIASAQIILGIGLFLRGKGLVNPDIFNSERESEFALGVGLFVAFVGFVLARYISGMAKQKAWSLLGAGSSQAIGASLFALVIAIGAFVNILGPTTMDRYLQIVLPIVMMLLGIEVFLNFLLDLYRPKRAQEAARAAIQSRVLSMLAAPDRIAESIGEAINYQLGTDVTGNWFYRLLSRSLVPLILIGLLVAWLMTSLAVVQPHQQGVLLRFGAVKAENIGPGLHFKYPWPIDRIHVPADVKRDERGRETSRTYTATGVRTLNLGSNPPPPPKGDERGDPILWTNDHALEEGFQIVLASSDEESADQEGQDLALVAIEVPVNYVIDDVLLFEQLAPPRHREELLRAVGQRAVGRYLAEKTMQEVLGSNRNAIAEELRHEIESAFGALNPGADGLARGAGVRVLYVGMQGSHPPKNVADAFENVIEAEQATARQIESAHKLKIETLTGVIGSVEAASAIKAQIDLWDAMQAEPEGERDLVAIAEKTAEIERMLDMAGGRAAQILSQARMERWAKHMGARGRAARFQGQIVAYEAQPQVYRASVYFDSLAKMFDGSRLFVTSDLLDVTVRMNLEDINTAAQEVFQSYGDE